MEEDRKSQLQSMKLLEAVKEMERIRERLEEIKAVKTEHQEEFDLLRLGIIPGLMDEDEITNITIDGVGRVTLTGDVYASIPASERDRAYQWLRDNNHGGLIVETVNSGTLKAFVKGVIKKGEELPEDMFKVTPFSRASITKK